MPGPDGKPLACSAPWGDRVEDGASVEAFKDPTTPYGKDPVSEVRVCHDGNLSGGFANKECRGLPKEPMQS